jgi:hypothetical protein
MVIRTRSRILTAALLGLILVSCDDSPTRPSPPSPQPSPATPTLVTTELVAPSRIAPGESQQLTLNAQWSDGTTTNVTAQTQWQTSNSRALTVTASGVLTGVANGEGSVSGRYSGMTRSRSLLVLPTGTFRLRGQVKEADLALDGVVISIESAGVKQASITNFGGGYVFYGVAGRTAIEARKDGYRPALEQVDVVEDRTFDVQLAPARVRTDFSGRWSLTISASACQSTRFGPLPDEAKTRRYTAAATQDGPHLRLTLADAEFVIVGGRGNTITGTTDPNDSMRLTLAGPSDYYYYYYRVSDLVERLNDGSQLVISGTVTASGDSRRVAGTLSGSFVLKSSTGTRTAECSAANHRFEMVRQ